MKFNLRLIIITFTVTILISVTSVVTIYFLTNKILYNQHLSSLLNTTHHFALTLETSTKKIDYEFEKLDLLKFNKINEDSLSIDFSFTLKNNNEINDKNLFVKKSKNIVLTSFNLKDFITNNPNIILKFKEKLGVTYYYGALIDTNYLNNISKEIRTEVAYIYKEKKIIASNSFNYNVDNAFIENTINKLSNKSNYDTYYEEHADYDLMGVLYIPQNFTAVNEQAKFVVFSVFKETAEYRSIMQLIIIILISFSIPISLIFVLIFTTKFRKQLAELNRVVEATRGDNLDERVKIISKDEIGKLGIIFNNMLDDIKRREETEHEYVKFITLINENASLTEVCNAVLKQIKNAVGFELGVFYVNNGEKFIQTAYLGLNNIPFTNETIENIYFNVIENKKPIEYEFTDNYPVINTALASIKLGYIIIYPILFNKEIIGILELSAIKKPEINVIDYLDLIIEQLSIGLSNAIAYERQKDLIKELRLLNQQYQNQNAKIKDQNEQLIKLHNELKENSIELEKQKQMALDSAKIKSQFLATMSHELRTPLNSILGLSELILNSNNLNAQNLERLKIVINNGKKLLGIINNILTFSKIETNNYEITKDKFLLTDFLRDIYISFVHFAEEKNLSFVIKNKLPNDTSLFTDRIKLEQILSNLISNAIKFTEKGGINITVEIASDNNLCITVKDTGIGISEENLGIIFKEFRQTSEGSDRKYSGTGLGLTIAKRMTELLGGKISVSSKINYGTIFSVILPDVIENIPYSDEKEHADQELVINIPSFKKSELRNVYIFSDNPDNIDFLSSYLKTNKFSTITVNDINNFESNVKLDGILIDYLSFSNPFMVIKSIYSKLNANVPIILFYYPVGEKSGIIFNSNLYLISPLTYDIFNEALNYSKYYYGKEINNVLTVGNSSFSGVSKDINLKNIKLADANIENILKEKPDCILIDFVTEDLLETEKICGMLCDKRFYEIPICVIIPDGELIDKEKLHKINLNIFNYIKKSVILKQDSLRVLRKKLKIGIPENLLTENEIINIEQIEVDKKKNKKEVVLIVDDDRDTLFTVGQIVESLGYDTLFAKDGLECLLLTENKKPDLVLLDIMMPNMDGFETLKRLKQKEKTKNIPVVALTAHAMMEEREIIIKNGFEDLITKPIDITYLSIKVRELLEGRKQ